jgi:hypothetical protein
MCFRDIGNSSFIVDMLVIYQHVKYHEIYAGIATNATILELERFSCIAAPIIFLSRIDYSNVSISELISFAKQYIFIPRLEDYVWAQENGKKPEFTILAGLIATRSCHYSAVMGNNTKYIITNGAILPEYSISDITAKRNIGWEKSYDGRFGYAITQHLIGDEMIYHNYAMSINHTHLQRLDGSSVDTIIKI